MYKKFLNAILFGALILGSAGTITSCKDYDDEIDEINQKLGTLSSKDELTSQISQLAGTISAAQTAASQAATEAANALAAAKDAAATAGQAVNTATSASGQSGEAFAAAKDAAAAAETAAVNTAAAAKSAASAAAEAKKAAESGAGSAVSAEKAQAAATAAQAAAAEASKNAAAATDAAQVSSKKAADAAASAATAEGTAKEVKEAAAAAAAAQAALAQAAAADAKKAEASAQSAASEAASAAAKAADAAGNAKQAAASADAAQAASKAAASAAEASKAAASAAAAQADAAKASAAAAEASAAAAQTAAADAKASAAASAAKADDAAKKATDAAKSASDAAASAAAAQTDAAAAKKAATDSAKDAAAASTAANDAKNSADLAKAASEAAASSASDAAASAKKASEDLQKALDSLEEVANAAAKKAAEDAKEAALKAIQSKLDDLQTEIDLKADGETTEAQIAEWRAELETMIAESSALIGHRLTDLAVIPTTHINGIAAITVKTLTYIPQKYYVWEEHEDNYDDLQSGSYHSYYRPILDHIAADYGSQDEEDFVGPVFISSEKNEAYYHVAPSNGVRTQDIKLPLFDNIVSENLITRADYDDENIPVVVNEPLEPTSYEINNNVLRVTFKKTTTDMLNPITEPEELYGEKMVTRMIDNGFDFGRRGSKEFFYMVSLKAPIAEENLLPEETEAFVNSEYTRVQEDVLVPYIAHKKADFTKPISYDYFADETQATDIDQAQAQDGRLFVHYHDSVCIYNSEYDEYIDIKAEYNKKLDLKEWVTVCTTDNFWRDHSNHEELADYADYGLGFRFYLAEAPYITLGGPDDNTLKTDQQQFAKVSVDGIMESKVYTIDGVNQTSVGREPIVRVELWDEVNDNLIAIRYIKVQWVKSIDVTPIEYVFNNALFACGPFESIIGTEEMNTKIYAQVQEGGMPKGTFHITYPEPENMEFTEGSENYGRVFLLRNDQDQVESYNILWTIAHTDIVKMIIKEYKGSWDLWFASGKPLQFTKTFKWKSPVAATLEITLKRDLYPEEFKLWGFDGRYWRTNTNYGVFNVNPVVFDTQEPNPAWNVPTNVSWETATNMNNPTNNIYTDLLNGFLDDMGKKPTTGADGAIYFISPVKASNRQYDANGNRFEYTYELGKKYYYAADYEVEATGKAVTRATDQYSSFSKEGVRFIYDVDKLNTDKYVYKYYDTTTGTYKDGYAKVVDNDDKEPKLYIVPNKNVDPSDEYLAATIVNYEPNLVERPNVNQPELTYNIKLQENNPDSDPYAGSGIEDPEFSPTEAAKALVNQYVPLMMVANLCEDNFKDDPEGGEYAHVATIKKYDAFIIEPLKPKTAKADDFTDATVGGSTIDVQGVNLYQSWNADEKGNYYPVMNGMIQPIDQAVEDLTVNAQGKLEGNASEARIATSQYIYDTYVKMGYTSVQALKTANLAFRLGRFYETTPAEWDTENITTNLALDEEGNLVPTEGVTTGPLPSNTEVVYNEDDETLTYHNYNGTPVNWNYKMYIPVRFGYKWKTQVNYVEVNVISNQGTDDHQD